MPIVVGMCTGEEARPLGRLYDIKEEGFIKGRLDRQIQNRQTQNRHRQIQGKDGRGLWAQPEPAAEAPERVQGQPGAHPG
jgi:hypothetical protein